MVTGPDSPVAWSDSVAGSVPNSGGRSLLYNVRTHRTQRSIFSGVNKHLMPDICAACNREPA